MAARKKKATKKAPRASADAGGSTLGADRQRGPREATSAEAEEMLVVQAFDKIAGAVPSGVLSRATKLDQARALLVDLGLREAPAESDDAAGPS